MTYQPHQLTHVHQIWLRLAQRDPDRPHYTEWGFRLKLFSANQRERKYRPKAPDIGYAYLLACEWGAVVRMADLTANQREVVELRRQGKTFEAIGRLRGRTKQSAQRIHSQALRHIDDAREAYPYTGLAEVYRAETLRK